jgi:formiminotetrahydrofolate cyclodeaminase
LRGFKTTVRLENEAFLSVNRSFETLHRFAEDEAAFSRAKALSNRLARLADEDAAAYRAFMEARGEEERRRTIEVPQEVAAKADEVALLAARVSRRLTSGVVADAEAAEELARAAALVARRLAEVNA